MDGHGLTNVLGTTFAIIKGGIDVCNDKLGWFNVGDVEDFVNKDRSAPICDSLSLDIDDVQSGLSISVTEWRWAAEVISTREKQWILDVVGVRTVATGKSESKAGNELKTFGGNDVDGVAIFESITGHAVGVDRWDTFHSNLSKACITRFGVGRLYSWR